MKERSERVADMLKNYMKHRKEEHLSNIQIAEIYGLSKWTVYAYLEEIARLNNCNREDLLDRDVAQGNRANTGQERRYTKASEVNALIADTERLIETTRKEIDELLSQEVL